MAKTDFIQDIFGVRSKQEGLNPDCGMRSRGGKKPVRSKREARRRKRVAEKENVGGERESLKENFSGSAYHSSVCLINPFIKILLPF